MAQTVALGELVIPDDQLPLAESQKIADEVWNYSLVELILALDAAALSVEGSEEKLRFRLLCSRIRIACPAAIVPWDAAKDERTAMPFTTAVLSAQKPLEPSMQPNGSSSITPASEKSLSDARSKESDVSKLPSVTTTAASTSTTKAISTASVGTQVYNSSSQSKSVYRDNGQDKALDDLLDLLGPAEKAKERNLDKEIAEYAKMDDEANELRARLRRLKEVESRSREQSRNTRKQEYNLDGKVPRKSSKYLDTSDEFSLPPSSDTTQTDTSSDEEKAPRKKNAKRAKKPKSKITSGTGVLKVMQSWQISFSGASDESPENFLKDLEECRQSMNLSRQATLRVLPSLLKGDARLWYRTEANAIQYRWEAFRKAFCRQYILRTDDEDILDELRARQQLPGEKMVSFLSKYRAMAQRLRDPPPEEKLVKMAFVRFQSFSTFADLAKIAKLYEREKELDKQYRPNKQKGPNAENPQKGGKFGKNKIASLAEAAACEASESDSSQDPPPQPSAPKNKRKKGKKAKANKANTAISAMDQNDTKKSVPQNVAPKKPGSQAGTAKKQGNAQQSLANKAAFKGVCYNCLQEGHTRRECPQPQTEPLCYRCGTRQVTFLTCYNCNPSKSTGNEESEQR